MPNGQTEKITIKTASGEMVDAVVPAGLSDDQIKDLVRQKMPELFSAKTQSSTGITDDAGQPLSMQDIQDLIDVRAKLPQGDPRADRLDKFLLKVAPQQMAAQNGGPDPRTFSGMLQFMDEARTQAGAYQTRKGGPIQNVNDTSGAQTNYAGLPEIVPKEGEDFADTMKRAIQFGKTVTPQMIQQQTRADLRRAPAALVAGPAMAAAQLAIPTTAAALTAPTAAGTSSIGTGILDASGQEIMREVARYGPSLGRQALQSTLGWIGRHPAIAAAAYEGARRAGIPLPNVIGWLAKAAGEAK